MKTTAGLSGFVSSADGSKTRSVMNGKTKT